MTDPRAGSDPVAPRGGGSFRSLLENVKAAEEDFEWYPTTPRMVAVVARQLDKHTRDCSILDIGAGDGRVLQQLAEAFEDPPLLYAIEKSTVLLEAQPENVIPVGTDLFEQNLTCLPVEYIFSNPPYSEFALWARVIIEAGHARKAFLVLPQRWKEDPTIALALTKRGATARVLHSDHFEDGARRARAVVDVIEIAYPLKTDYYAAKPLDPFDQWFDENVSTFDAEDVDRNAYETERADLARIREFETIGDLVAGYDEEYARMEANYRAIFTLDYALLKELGVNKENVREGIKKKMAGLKAKYWQILFERLTAITDRLSTATKAKLTAKLTGQVGVAFTMNNAYAIVIWAIKNANRYFNEQTVALYRSLSTFDGALRYKSNVRTWEKNDWRYYRSEEEGRPTHYALDYRIVVERHGAIFPGGFTSSYDYPGGLYKGCHDLISDVIAVLYNLGFPCVGRRSTDINWRSGEWRDWYRVGNPGDVLFQVKAFKNGNLHFRFLPDAIRALNVEAGRLLGWLRAPADVVEELGYTAEEAERLFACTNLLGAATSRLLLGGSAETGAA